MRKFTTLFFLLFAMTVGSQVFAFEYEGLSYEDISKITNTTLGTVKSRISRARLKLQEQLKEFI